MVGRKNMIKDIKKKVLSVKDQIFLTGSTKNNRSQLVGQVPLKYSSTHLPPCSLFSTKPK
jgi:hypothetical protein